jgi:hypothetical protein
MTSFKTLDRFIACIVDIEYEGKFCDDEDAIDAFVHCAELDMPSFF